MHKSHLPYLVAAAYALAVTVFALALRPIPPRFLDLYLIGIMLVTLRWNWHPAALVLVISIASATWILPSLSTVEVTGGATEFRMVSYTLTSAFAMYSIEYAKSRIR